MPIRIARCSSAAVARAERDQPGILGIGERHARLGDRAPARRSPRRAVSTSAASTGGEIAAAARERRFGLAPSAQNQRGRQQRGELRQGNRGERAAPRRGGLGAEPGRLGAERGRRDRRDCGSPRPAIPTRAEIVTAPDNSSRAARPSATARRRVRTARRRRGDTWRSRCRFSSLTNSAARASTASPWPKATPARRAAARKGLRRWLGRLGPSCAMGGSAVRPRDTSYGLIS